MVLQGFMMVMFGDQISNLGLIILLNHGEIEVMKKDELE